MLNLTELSLPAINIFQRPLSMAGQERTVATPTECQMRCRKTPGCYVFTSFRDGGCFVSTGADGKIKGSASAVQAGDVYCAASNKITPRTTTGKPSPRPTPGPTPRPIRYPTNKPTRKYTLKPTKVRSFDICFLLPCNAPH